MKKRVLLFILCVLTLALSLCLFTACDIEDLITGSNDDSENGGGTTNGGTTDGGTTDGGTTGGGTTNGGTTDDGTTGSGTGTNDGSPTENSGNQTTYKRNGNKISFGSYPQTEVTDNTLKATLTNKSGTLPTSENAQSWTSYEYYIEGIASNYMWYIDIEVGEEKYRGVYFTSYRPFYTSASNASTHQVNNGYTTGTVYWFRYEPIIWTIFSENTDDKTALVLCDMIIDSQAYQNEYEKQNGKNYNTSSGVPSGTYANNYAKSTIRKWLNETFYNTAFSELQKQIILTTTTNNSESSTGYSPNLYVCENTEDKIFLLSYEDVTNSNYGFSLDYDEIKQKKSTDYAKSQGLVTHSNGPYAGCGVWWLRSPGGGFNYSNRAFGIGYGGYIDDDAVDVNRRGIVPALQLKL